MYETFNVLKWMHQFWQRLTSKNMGCGSKRNNVQNTSVNQDLSKNIKLLFCLFGDWGHNPWQCGVICFQICVQSLVSELLKEPFDIRIEPQVSYVQSMCSILWAFSPALKYFLKTSSIKIILFPIHLFFYFTFSL